MFERVMKILQEKIDPQLDTENVEIVPDRHISQLFAVRTAKGTDYVVNEATGSVERVSFDEWPPR